MSSHCAHISCTIYTLPAPLALPLISIWIFSPLTHIVPTPIHLCSLPSSLFLVQGYNHLAKFFHWAFPNLEGSEHASTLYSSLIFIGKLELQRSFPVSTVLNASFRVFHLEWRSLPLRVKIFGDFSVPQLLGLPNVPIIVSTQLLAPIRLLFLHGSFCSKWFNPTH